MVLVDPGTHETREALDRLAVPRYVNPSVPHTVRARPSSQTVFLGAERVILHPRVPGCGPYRVLSCGFVLPSLTMAEEAHARRPGLPNPLAVLRASSTFVGDLPALAEQLTYSIGDLSGLIAEQVSVYPRTTSPPPANKSPRRRRCGRRRLRCAGNSL